MSSILPKIKILCVIDNLSTGGAQRQMINLALGLTQRGHHVEFFCYMPGDLLAGQLSKSDIQVHWHYKRNRFSPQTIIVLRNLIKTRGFDLVLSFLHTPNLYAIISSKLLEKRPVPVVVSERSCDLPHGIPLSEEFSRQFYRWADRVVTNSYHQHSRLERKYLWMKNRLSTIYNGYDLSYWIPPHEEPLNQPLKMLVVASVSPYKNGLCLIEAMNILRHREGLVVSVDWVGQHVMEGKRLKYLIQMNQTIKNDGLDEQWNWLHQRTDMIDLLHQHDVLIHPSFIEGLPNVVCEALACGRPVIVSDILDHPRLIQDRVSGYLFNYNDPYDLASKIKILYEQSPEERRKMGLQGRMFAEEHLSLDRLVDDYEGLFTLLLDEAKQ